MARKVGAEGLEAALDKILNDYSNDVGKSLEKVIEKAGKAGAKALRESSPIRTGNYAKGWTAKTERAGLLTTSTIHNKTAPGLAHLLEYGHAKRGGGRTRPIIHIKPIEEQLKAQLQDVFIKEYG